MYPNRYLVINFLVNYVCNFGFYVYIFLIFCFIYSLGKDYFKFLTKYLAAFSGEDAYTMSEAKEEAVRTIIEFVRAPDMFQVCN